MAFVALMGIADEVGKKFISESKGVYTVDEKLGNSSCPAYCLDKCYDIKEMSGCNNRK